MNKTEGGMSKDQFRGYLYKEPLEPKHQTSEEAFEEGRRAAQGVKPDMTGYDAAGRKLTRVMLEWAEKSAENRKLFLERCRTPKYKNLGSAGVELDDIAELKKEIDAIGPTGFMFGYAVASVKWLVSNDG